MTYACIDGQLLPPEKAAVPVDDRAFRYGDGIFETVAVHGGRPYLWDLHAARMEAASSALALPLDVSGILESLRRLIERNGVREGGARIQISRGSGGRGYLLPASPAPRIVIETFLTDPAPSPPVTLWCGSWRKISRHALPVALKLTQGMNSILALREARENGCHDSLMLGEHGQICESSSANIFWESGGVLYTPSPGCGALDGVMRRRILALSPWPVREGRFFIDCLLRAEAAALTNVIRKAVPVGALLPFGKEFSGGNLADKLNALIAEDVEASMKSR